MNQYIYLTTLRGILTQKQYKYSYQKLKCMLNMFVRKFPRFVFVSLRKHKQSTDSNFFSNTVLLPNFCLHNMCRSALGCPNLLLSIFPLVDVIILDRTCSKLTDQLSTKFIFNSVRLHIYLSIGAGP